jgi:hypothetical protein
MATQVDPGTDLSLWPDVDPGGTFISGSLALAQALVRRLTTPRGGLFYDSSYGTDIRQFLSEMIDSSRLGIFQQRIEQEVLQDERVLAASALLTFNDATNTMSCSLTVQTANGPFVLTLAVSSVTVTLLQIG